MQILVCLFQSANTILPDSNSWLKYNFNIKVIAQGHTEVINVRETLYRGDTLT